MTEVSWVKAAESHTGWGEAIPHLKAFKLGKVKKKKALCLSHKISLPAIELLLGHGEVFEKDRSRIRKVY